jgi:hypothetical protein
MDYNYVKTGRPSEMNSIVNYDKSEATLDLTGNNGGLYTPDITVETQVRVLYRIGLQAVK